MNIFDDTNKVKGNWVQWKAVGTEVQGTYMSKRQVLNRASGQQQWVYELLAEDGTVWNVGGKPAVDAQMKYIKPGQIVGFKFMEERPSKVSGKSATKIIQVFANPKLVNEKWLQEQEEAAQNAEAVQTTDGEKEYDISEVPGFKEEAKVDPAAVKSPDQISTTNEKLGLIEQLAAAKLGVKNPSEMKLKVMEATHLAFIESNFDKILEVLAAK